MMPPGVTHTRDPWLWAAAAVIAGEAPHIAAVLRASRIESWWEADASDIRALAAIVGETDAEFYAARLRARLTIPSKTGAYETVTEDGGLTLDALQAINPDVAAVEIVEAIAR